MTTLALTLCLTLALAAGPPAGRRVALDGGASLFVPEGFRPAPGGVVDVLIHLHGAAAVVETAFVETEAPGVLVVFNRRGLSGVYAEPFADPDLFTGLLAATFDALKAVVPAGRLTPGRVTLSSFSAGFGGVRAILKVPGHFARVDGLVMADSLYCGYRGDPALRQIDPALMDGFRRFAREAAAGRKTFLLTHSAQVPPGYAGTTETADFLVADLGGIFSRKETPFADGLTLTRSFRRGRFTVLGFSGGGPADHTAHLRRISRFWALGRDPHASPPAPPAETPR